MPSKTVKQRNYIFYLRGKYKTKEKTPEKDKWIWEADWNEIEETFSEIVPPIPMEKAHKEESIKPYKRKFLE